MKPLAYLSAAVCGAAMIAGCSTTDNVALTRPQSVAWNVDPAIPAAVRAPRGHVLLGHVIGRGVQTFTLQADPVDPTRSIWVPTRDEGGDLLDDNGHVIGHHEGGSWSIQEGGQVTASAIGQVPRPGRGSVTLYQTLSHEGGGLMGSAEYIEQLHNVGGPPIALSYGTPGTQFRAEYSADYYFYGSVAPQTRANRGGAYVGG